MTTRHKIMDKYWLQFLYAKGHMTQSTSINSVEGIFWEWFSETVMTEFGKPTSLEEFLK